MGNLYNCGDFQPGVPFVFLKASNELFNKVVEARIYLNFLWHHQQQQEEEKETAIS